ncbi:TPA: hypothetical protein U5E25_001605 [Yersinia enterocolitica]|nr:hypothetical protein [Yersinia enterocolitica]
MDKHFEGLISNPVGWTDADELADMDCNTHGNIFNAKYIDIHNGRWLPLYSQEYVDSLIAQLKAATKKQFKPVVLPKGFILVPKNPTAEMIAAALECDDVAYDLDDDSIFCVRHDEIYTAMLSAVPHDELFTAAKPSGDIRALVESEIGDFCAGLNQPGEPASPEEIQRQLLQRIIPLLLSAKPDCE